MIGKDNFAEADNLFFLPETKKGFSSVDILLVTGDAYLDHPSFGIAIIARVLENAGYKIAIWSQPDYRNAELLKKLPEVRLFIGITAGNIDSVVSNYTGTRSRRKDDAYSIDGNPLFPQGHQKRPDRATIVYTSFLKQRYKNIPIVLGGIEASLRRFAHYDYVQDKIRHSVLLDSKADIISYGMGEKSMIEIANRIKEKQSLKGIEGTVIKIKPEECEGLTALPSYEEIINDKEKLLEMTALIEANMVHETACGLYQKDGTNIVASFRPQPLLTQKELDDVYALPFRRNFPEYCERVPAWKMIQHSVTSHRGCFGRCSFCAIASHQGPLVSRRSEESIIAEVKKIALLENFHGTISDIGGPTANMYASFCKIGGCKDPKCLFPKICPNLQMNQADYVDLLFKIKNLPEVKHVFINSGIRYDMALEDKNAAEQMICNFTSGHLKIAPEHFCDDILRLMRKPSAKEFERFIAFFEQIKKKNHLNFYMLPYLILSHPGSTNDSARAVGNFLLKHNISTRQYQDFTPTPQTISTAMFVSGKNMQHKDINIVHYSAANNPQRKILENMLRYKKK